MNKEKKDYSRCVRMTETIRQFVEGQKGEGFNEKFENMVLYCMTTVPTLNSEIKAKEKQKKDLQDKISKLQGISTTLDNIKWDVELILKKADSIAKDKQM